jgi:succinoglycan biosynthesis transport protein ExoP
MAVIQTTSLGMERESDVFALDVFGLLRRRKWIGVFVAVVGFAGAAAFALLWPPTYRSTATILIEEPDVPDDLVKSTVSTFADDRLQVIQQRVMTSQNLSDIIDRFSLYSSLMADHPRSELIDLMRQKIDLEVVSANLFGPQQTRTNQPKATIAFTVSFDSGNPQVAQQVASRLTDLYLAENVQSRQEKAAGTTEFLAQQSLRLYNDVTELEKKLTLFKTKYAGSLPEQLNVNMQILGQAQNQLLGNRRDASALGEKKAFLQDQLTQVSPYLPMTSSGRAATPQAELMSLELQYVDLSARYGPKHPDVVHLQKQIDTLKAQVGTGTDRGSGQLRLTQLQQQLQDALQRYGENHPQVQKLRKQIDDLKVELGKAPQTSMISTPKGPPDNPVYIQMQSQLGDANAQLQGLQAQTATLEKTVQDLQARVLLTPSLESDYASLQQQYTAAITRYQNFKDKESDAQVAQNMEQQSKGETFSVIEAPQFPDIPVKPNRKLLLAVGAAMSMMLAAGLMVALEFLDRRIYQPHGLQVVFGEAPLATVPYIPTRKERTVRIAKASIGALVVIAATAVALLVVNATVIPLDVLVAAAIERINP